MPDPATLPEPFETAAQAFKALLDTLGAGRHHLVCSAHTDLGSFASVSTTVDRAPDDQDLMEADGEGSLMFCHLLAQTSLGYRDAAIFTRTYASEDKAVLRGWRVTAGGPNPWKRPTCSPRTAPTSPLGIRSRPSQARTTRRASCSHPTGPAAARDARQGTPPVQDGPSGMQPFALTVIII
ncbi:hypothetical protein [Streptomyces sp. WAC 01325]|uniref:hypothetical protein n=1 Tax=Streptomyces sp. WAC 01325 TaxID=2203202 RepID=UPI000F88AAEE|nr:hypothetical protein [Streptomyces sp. WAC 01325]